MTPWVGRLLFANVAAFVVTLALPGVADPFVLVPALLPVRPWTMVSYMFLHAGLWHLLFNMLGLFFFGPRLESRLGGRQFLILYFASGIAGALLSLPFTPLAAIVGASGAVFGVFLGFARYWPRERIFIWGVVPIEARWLVAIMTGLALFGGFGGGGGGIAHFAHLGGFVGGFACLKLFERRHPGRTFRERAAGANTGAAKALKAVVGERAEVARWARINRDMLHEVNRAELDRVMEKIERLGVASLTAEDRAFLNRFSER